MILRANDTGTNPDDTNTPTLESVCSAFDVEREAIESLIDDLRTVLDLDGSKIEYVKLLGLFLGSPFNEGSDDTAVREIVKATISLHKRKGTLYGLDLINRYRNLGVDISELYKTEYNERLSYSTTADATHTIPSSRIIFTT